MDAWYIPADEAHIRRERERARALRASAWWQAQLAKGECHYCHKRFPPGELTMDHVIPVARGGKSTKGNVVPACLACNRAKAATTALDALLDALPGGGEPPDPADFADFPPPPPRRPRGR